jgi:hypothetical protein
MHLPAKPDPLADADSHADVHLPAADSDPDAQPGPAAIAQPQPQPEFEFGGIERFARGAADGLTGPFDGFARRYRHVGPGERSQYRGRRQHQRRR